MNNDAKNELQGILSAYQAKLMGSQNREAKLKTERLAFTELFRNLKTKIIAPVFAEFAAQLNEYGHVASVLDQEEPSHKIGSFSPANITLRIVPAVNTGDVARSSNGPIEVKYSANTNEMNVLVSSTHNPRGTSGKRGDYQISELTEEFVVKIVLGTLREAFSEGH